MSRKNGNSALARSPRWERSRRRANRLRPALFHTELKSLSGQVFQLVDDGLCAGEDVPPGAESWFGALVARIMGVVFALFRPGKQPPLTLETVRLIGKRLEVSNALAKRELGYAPKVSREVGVERLRATASSEVRQE